MKRLEPTSKMLKPTTKRCETASKRQYKKQRETKQLQRDKNTTVMRDTTTTKTAHNIYKGQQNNHEEIQKDFKKTQGQKVRHKDSKDS